LRLSSDQRPTLRFMRGKSRAPFFTFRCLQDGPPLDRISVALL